MKKSIVLAGLLTMTALLTSQQIKPVRDDVGFCWDRAQMHRLIQYLKSHQTEAFDHRNLVAGISPHDDYLYAGQIYFPLFNLIHAKEVVIFGVTHAAVRQEIGDPQNTLIMDEYPAWPGLGRSIEVSPLRNILKTGLDERVRLISNRAHELEHSIEALLPFLQYFNPEIKIIPIMVSPMNWETMEQISGRLAAIIATYIRDRRMAPGKDIFFLISADANHYGADFKNTPFGEGKDAHRAGIEQDQRVVREYLCGPVSPAKLAGLTRELWGTTYRDYRNTYWCGKYDIPFGLLTIEKTVTLAWGRQLKGKLFRYSDTYSEGVIPLKKAGFGITAPFSLKHWVGFFSIGYFLD